MVKEAPTSISDPKLWNATRTLKKFYQRFRNLPLLEKNSRYRTCQNLNCSAYLRVKGSKVNFHIYQTKGNEFVKLELHLTTFGTAKTIGETVQWRKIHSEFHTIRWSLRKSTDFHLADLPFQILKNGLPQNLYQFQ